MGWKKQANVAQYGGASWDKLVAKKAGMTAESAMRFAFANPDITYFFFVRQGMSLGGPGAAHNPFLPGDAVFFSGSPWYGSAPQCDAYEKTPISTVYISPTDTAQFDAIGDLTQPDGTPSVDVVCLFAGNYATNTPPMLRANNNDPVTSAPLNPNVQAAIERASVLQDKGITVLLSVMGAHSATGWSQFTDQATAQAFVDYLKSDVVDRYGLDGIDIDDEYSNGPANNTSLAMVTTLMRQTMPDKLVTKALCSRDCGACDDSGPFSGDWNGHTLASNLHYGWEMCYMGRSISSRLSAYVGYGMSKNRLSLGFSAESWTSRTWPGLQEQAHAVVADGYAGCMLFSFENQPESLTLLEHMLLGMGEAG
jgi:hypothetical protein